MKSIILLLAFSAFIFTSCSTYKAGQTPDDVYYSPTKIITAKEETKKEQKNDRYEEYVSSEDDQYLRMKIRNRERWSSIDDYSYWYDSRFDHCYCNCNNTYTYNYNYNTSSYNPWRSNYYGHGSYYSPSYPIVYYKNPRTYTATTGKPNLSSYSNKTYNNSRQGFGNTLIKIFSNNNSNNSNSSSSTTAPTRTYNPPASSSSSSSSGSSSSGSGGVSRPPRN